MLVYKGKGDPLNTSFSQGIKLLEHAFKCYNKRYEKKLREITDTGKMQYSFKSGKEATNVVLVLKRMI